MSKEVIDRPSYRAQNLPPGAKWCGPPCKSYSGSGDEPDANSKTQKRKQRRIEAIKAGKWDPKTTPAPKVG